MRRGGSPGRPLQRSQRGGGASGGGDPGDVAPHQDLDAAHRRDRALAEELEPHSVTSSAAIAVAALAPPEVDPADDRLTERYCAKPAKLAQPARPR